GPRRGAPDDWIGIVEPADERWDGRSRGLAAPPQHERGIAEQPGAPGPRQRGRFQRAAKRRRVARQPGDQVGVGPFGTWLELGRPSGGCLAVPGADVLADVATEDPVAELVGERVGDRSLVLDGPVADAAAGVELVGTGEGVGR